MLQLMYLLDRHRERCRKTIDEGRLNVVMRSTVQMTRITLVYSNVASSVVSSQTWF